MWVGICMHNAMTRSSKLPFGYLCKPSDYQNMKFPWVPLCTMCCCFLERKARWERFNLQIRRLLMSNLNWDQELPLRKLKPGSGAVGKAHAETRSCFRNRGSHMCKSPSHHENCMYFYRMFWNSYTVLRAVECCWIKSSHIKFPLYLMYRRTILLLFYLF